MLRPRARERIGRKKQKKKKKGQTKAKNPPHTKTKTPNKKISFMKSVSLVIPVTGVFSNKMIKGLLVADFF